MADLSKLKIGDPVVIWQSNYSNSPDSGFRSIVAAITKAGNFKIKGSDSVWLKNGRYRGADSYSRSFLEPFDEEKWNRNLILIQEMKDRRKARELDFNTLDIKRVQEILRVASS